MILRILQSFAAVIAGYFIFAVSALAFFRVAGQAPHEVAPLPIMLGSITVGVTGAFAGGYIAALIAKRRPLAHGIAVACVLALGATVSLVSTLGQGSIWSQLAALVLMAPSAACGGWARVRQTRSLSPSL